MALSTFKLPPFNGTKPAYRSFINNVYDIAAKLTSIHRHGVASHVFSPDVYASVFGGDPPYVLEDPGARPSREEVGTAAGGREWQYWSHITEETRKFQEACSVFSDLLWNALDATTQRRCSDANGRQLPPKDVVDFLIQTFGTRTHEDFRSAMARLAIPHGPSDALSDLVATHEEVHAVMKASGNPISSHLQVELFEEALRTCLGFATALEVYTATHPTVGDQSFASLSAAMLTHESNSPATHSLADFAGQAAAHSVWAAKLDALEQSLERKYEAKFAALALEKRTGGTKVKRASGQRAASTPEPDELLYCHTHGAGGHSGVGCHSRGPNHRPEATMQNKMGGEQRTSRERRRADMRK